jgi:hypothetical protein
MTIADVNNLDRSGVYRSFLSNLHKVCEYCDQQPSSKGLNVRKRVEVALGVDLGKLLSYKEE